MKELFVRLFTVPEFSIENCFRGPVSHTFNMVDWFNIPSTVTSDELKKFIKSKPYYKVGKKILVMDNHDFSMVIICD